MEVDILVSGQPLVVLGLVGVQVVEDHVDFFARILCNHIVRGTQKLSSVPSLVMSHLDLTRSNFQRREERGGPMTLILMTEARQHPAIGRRRYPWARSRA